MYQLIYHPHAVKKLRHLHPDDRKKIITKLEALSKDPQNLSLQIKKLVNT